MEEFLLSAAKLEVYLPAEPVMLAPTEIGMLRQARRRRIACQGEPIHAYLVVGIPPDQKYQGRSLREYAHFYSNLQVSLQILQSVAHTDGDSKETLRPIQCTTLLRSGTLSGPMIVESGRDGEWRELGTTNDSTLLPSGEVVYRIQAAMAVDKELIGKNVILRIQIAPSTFPVDEYSFPMPGIYEFTQEAERISRSMQAISMRAAGSKGPRPSYFMDVTLTIIDPLKTAVSITPVGASALVWLQLRNERTDGAVIRIDSVLGSEGALGNMVWEGAGRTQQFPIVIEGGGEYCLIGRADIESLALAKQPPRLLVWWGGPGVSGGVGSDDAILKIIEIQDHLTAAGNPESDQLRLHMDVAEQVVLGRPFRLTMTIKNVGTRERHISLLFPNEEMQRLRRENSGTNGKGTSAHRPAAGPRSKGQATSDRLQQPWALLPLVASAEFGVIASSRSVSRSLEVLPMLEGVAKLEGLFLVDSFTNEMFSPRSDWTCFVHHPQSVASAAAAATRSKYAPSSAPLCSPIPAASGQTPEGRAKTGDADDCEWDRNSRERTCSGLESSGYVDALSPS